MAQKQRELLQREQMLNNERVRLANANEEAEKRVALMKQAMEAMQTENANITNQLSATLAASTSIANLDSTEDMSSREAV